MRDTHALAFVVLEGEQAGARARIKFDESVVVGSELDGDIVLRDRQLNGNRFRLNAGVKYARVEVLSGFVEIHGQKISQGTLAKLSPYTPLKIGSTTVAYGVAEHKKWEELQSLRKRLKNNSKADPLKQENINGTKTTKKSLGGTLWIIALILITALITFNNLPDETVTLVTKSQSEITKVLDRAGFSALKVDETNDGVFIIQGNLDTNKQQTFLEKILSDLNILYDLRVLVSEQLAITVQEFYRVNGIPASVKSQGSGVVGVKTREADLKKLARVESLAKKDVVGLSEIMVENTKPPKPIDTKYKINNPGKRIASIVPGNPAYLITLDGTRYFIGAMMPSGHKISAISDQKVLLDKGGTMSTLEF